MSQTINTNIATMNTQRNLDMSGVSLQSALQHLSSGLRINSTKDDATGLAFPNKRAYSTETGHPVHSKLDSLLLPVEN